MNREELLKKLIDESIDLEEKKKLQEQIKEENSSFDDHHGTIIGNRIAPLEDSNEE